MENRRSFIKQVSCLTGVCLCGFSSFLKAESAPVNNNFQEPNTQKILMHEWISTLLLSMDKTTDKETCKTIMKKCAVSHYDSLKMDEFLAPFIGEIENFNRFIEKEWGWKVTYRKDEGVILADENKKVCVCPMADQKKGVKSSILCFCSEGFAELMFSKVAGHSVKAEVISSIHRGDNTCVYKISLS